jgi:Raf kinase inhibitor-like YbhB/YbcL family protein
MKLSIPSFTNGAAIPGEYAFCIPAREGHVTLAPNRNPELRWSGVPKGTRSLAVLCHDADAPSRRDDANQEGRTVPKTLARVDFFHWVLVDIPPTVEGIDAGTHSDGVTPRGKPLGPAPRNQGVHGRNDYTSWFEGDPDMDGTYAGYDGPCPPWNDERVHHYHFRVYALDVQSLDLHGDFGGADARKAMEGHILAEAEWLGTYTLNRALL